MKNISAISSVTTKTEISPNYSLNEEGFEKQLKDAISAANQLETDKHKMGKENSRVSRKSAQDEYQISLSQMGLTAPTRTHVSATTLNAYQTQKPGIKSKTTMTW